MAPFEGPYQRAVFLSHVQFSGVLCWPLRIEFGAKKVGGQGRPGLILSRIGCVLRDPEARETSSCNWLEPVISG